MSARSKISILITRNEEDSCDLTRSIGDVEPGSDINYTYLPLMEITKLPIDETYFTHSMQENFWMLFTSQNAVEAVFTDNKDWGKAKIAAIGERTAAAIKKLGLEVSFTPAEARAETFALEFTDHLIELDTNPDIYLFQGSTAAGTLQKDLESKGHHVKKIICYRVERKKLSVENRNDLSNFLSRAQSSEGIQILCILSSLQAEYLLSNLTEPNSCLLKYKAQTYAIGKTTAQTLRGMGFENVHVLGNSSLVEMGKAIGEFLKLKK